MHFHAVYSSLHGGTYTTEELNEAIADFFGEDACYPLQETENGLFWLGKKLIPRKHYLYLPQGKQNRVPEQEDEAEVPCWRQKEKGKQVSVHYPMLYRGDKTNWLWKMETLSCYVDLGGVGHMVETLTLEEDGAEFVRCIVTDDPCRTGTSPRFRTYEAGGEITITGVQDYTEQLTIPAQLNGKPVAAVYMSYSQELRHLRTLTVEEGVRRMDFCWGTKSLEEIHLPKSLELVDQPSYMHYSAWYAAQPEGPVYFQNWYLGTKGEPVRRELKIREGTVGIVREADQISWDSIVLPKSLTFIGDYAFPHTRVPPRVTYAPGTEELRAAFDLFSGCFELTGIPEHLPDLPGEILTAKGLYDLGTSCQGIRPAIRRRGTALAPRFRFFQGRWVADVLYYTKRMQTICYYAVIDVESGKLLEMRKQGSYIPPFPHGDVCTSRHKNRIYRMAEDYLTFCADQIRKGQPPQEETIQKMNLWWYRTLPEDIQRDIADMLEKKQKQPGRRRAE